MVFFISGAPDFLVEKMARKYDVTDYSATNYLVDGRNNFTGEVVRMWDSDNKQRALNDLVKNYNVDLASSYSYGDTTGDLSMLKMVGHPVAINPVKEFFTAIREDEQLSERVKIVVERKNVIYKIDPHTEILDL